MARVLPACRRRNRHLKHALSFRLFTSDDVVGALNLYSTRPLAFAQDSRSIGAVLAAHPAIALVAAREHENAKNLRIAVDTNRAIGTAVGIFMIRYELDQAQAFDFLIDTSQKLNRKLRSLAEIIVDGRGLPEMPASLDR